MKKSFNLIMLLIIIADNTEIFDTIYTSIAMVSLTLKCITSKFR